MKEEYKKEYKCTECGRMFDVVCARPKTYQGEAKIVVQCPRENCLVPQKIDWPIGYMYAVNPK